MHIDRPMVSLFFEIKRNMPIEERDGMKIAAPDLGEKLVNVYRGTQDSTLKKLVSHFLTLAGSEWAQQLKTPKNTKSIFYPQLAQKPFPARLST